MPVLIVVDYADNGQFGHGVFIVDYANKVSCVVYADAM